MIFVTVGTHEQQFNRLVQCVDELREKQVITEDVVIQAGFSTYEPKSCGWSNFYPYQRMLEYVKEARIVITHGGPASFIMPLQVGKIPIVVPRKKEFSEHINDHQVNFCRTVAERQGNILVVENISKLSETIARYDNIIAAMSVEMKSNNVRFCSKLDGLVKSLF